ncbi:ig-like domain-containing protein [Caerostris darwini]|uniref:Ig-like domain-containing protein n=1 Tax=Caerostris darwini TaxID=1538125 RepID=A0AAV4PXA9_9ARAC|nr:ig-like domain-containing protein [Caerostris darwini]
MTQKKGKNHFVNFNHRIAPVCKNRAVQVFGVAKQETLNITCELEADPIDVKFHWTLNNTVESMEVKKFVSEGTSSTVFYTPRNMLGYGALLCWGSNDIGRQKDPCVYRIVPVDKFSQLESEMPFRVDSQNEEAHARLYFSGMATGNTAHRSEKCKFFGVIPYR